MKLIGKILRWAYHRVKWTKQTRGGQPLNGVLAYFDKIAHMPEFSHKIVDIVVPVYNAYDHLLLLFHSIYNNSDIPFNLIIIDDKSTDERVSVLLNEFACEHDNISLIHNDENLGFVQSVNKGLQLSKNDVVIVNSDVEVPTNWLSRLMYPIFEMQNTASVTPMSNSSTITSFPEILKSNELFEGRDIEYIDEEFKKIRCHPDIYIETPTGHGFCMAMSREAIKKIGYFDEKAFGQGYGEENDWCMRSIKSGYKNFIAPNVFCFHNHTSSFTSEQRQHLIEKHVAIIRKRYPNYSSQVKKTSNDKFYKSLRQIVLTLIHIKSAQRTILCLTNSLGGGAMFANKDFIEEHKKNNILIINIRSSFQRESYQIEFHHDNHTFTFNFERIGEIEKILSVFDIDEIVIHQLCGYVKLEQLLKIISTARQRNGFMLKMDIRDFFIICPTVQLLDNKGKFCHACVDMDICTECISSLGPMDPSFVNIAQWRKMWQDFLSCLDEINVYSNFTRRTILKIYCDSVDVDKIEVGRIPINYVTPVKMCQKKQDAPVIIGVIGNILIHKGLQLLNEMAGLIHSSGNTTKVKLFIIGKLDMRYNHPFFEHVGKYKREDISNIIEKHDIDIVFIPSIWGETYCRTAQEAMLMEVPVACFDLGAPSERVSEYDKGLVISQVEARVALNEIVEYVKELRCDRDCFVENSSTHAKYLH